jgi:hypothetical protein
MQVGKVRTRLAQMIERLLGEEYYCNPEDINVNRSANFRNDGCVWTGTAFKKEDQRYLVQLCSWNKMTEIVKHKNLVLVGSKKIEIGPNEVTFAD